MNPFPHQSVEALANQGKKLLVVELNAGQMVQDVRLAVGDKTQVGHLYRLGGNLPSAKDILSKCGEMMS